MVAADAAVTGGAMAGGYPPEWKFDGLLMDGEAVVVRPIQPADAPALVSLQARVAGPTPVRSRPVVSRAAQASPRPDPGAQFRSGIPWK